VARSLGPKLAFESSPPKGWKKQTGYGTHARQDAKESRPFDVAATPEPSLSLIPRRDPRSRESGVEEVCHAKCTPTLSQQLLRGLE
jgi:hypothetical protein